jgi:hypothetical protein
MTSLGRSTESDRIRHSLSLVGPKKVVGYLPLYTIRDILHARPEDLIEEAKSRGLCAIVLGPDRCCIKSGALYTYHRTGLQRLLEASTGALRASGLSADPDRFIEQIGSVWFEPNEPAWAVIKAAFGEDSI